MAWTKRGNRGKSKRRPNPKPKIRITKPVLKSKSFFALVTASMCPRLHCLRQGTPKVFSRIKRCTSKLVMDVNVINKEDTAQVEIFLECILENRVVEIIYLYGPTPLQAGGMFEKLLLVLQKLTVWSINLGEIKFSASRLKEVQTALAQSNVTHMFYECMKGSQLKKELIGAIRENRKHTKWKYSDDDDAHNNVVRNVVKNWFNPKSHTCNKGHGERHNPCACLCSA
jgi:hypothetical protein